MIMHMLHALLYGAVSLGKAYDLTEEPEKAMDVYERLIKMLDVIFEGEPKMLCQLVAPGGFAASKTTLSCF